MKKPVALFIELKIAAKTRYICDITEKLFENDISVTIFSNDDKTAAQINDQLWTWKQDSFIPHCITSSPDNSDPVVITTSSESLPNTQVLILADPLPADKIASFSLIIDFAEVYHADKKLESRQRYKMLKDSEQYDLHFTQLGAFLAKEKISLSSAQ